jgi:excinuclease UvrABC nuclease subunit
MQIKEIECPSFFDYCQIKFNHPSFEEKKQGVVYFLFYKNSIVYIGKTVNIKNRINSHFSNKKFDSVFYLEVHNHLTRVENMYIDFFRPLYNKRIEKTCSRFAVECIFEKNMNVQKYTYLQQCLF